ncbi:sugar transferase [Flavobacterium cellulosilyticum]|uniref:Sugar transferase n=1 Tax=Flavobacterium cellulosilyticum TaxID=2541731 RepID=A0A4V2YZX7_9FLAO|nr:sugar transferase [Flavobacterium cellulosilyticum]TDD98367.1 sugar transferase [Flavobacterium cellulosilyticum]
MTKRLFDIFFSLLGLFVVGWLILILWILASFDTKSNGFFIQERIGQFGKPFKIVKLKTMHPLTAKISVLGSFLRNSKMDELPQLWNIFIGNMSFVGPRPDIVGYYDTLQGEDRKILELKPGLTSTASLKYYNEEVLLAQVDNPMQYNDEILFPDKVKLNLEYYYNHSFLGDLNILWKTIYG